MSSKAQHPGKRRGVFALVVRSLAIAIVCTSSTGSCLDGKERSSKIYRRLGKPDESWEAVRVVVRRDGQEAQGAEIAGRGWESNRAGSLPGLLHTDAAQGWHPVLYVAQTAGRGTDAGTGVPKTRPNRRQVKEGETREESRQEGK